VYETALCSGLRAGELRALRVADLDADGGGLRLSETWTKNRRPGFQPLPSALVKRLTEIAQRRDPADALLDVGTHQSRLFELDLAAAGIPKDAPGGRAVFHTLRVTYTSLVFEQGASLKEAQTLARHVTPGLTLNVYGRAREERLADLAEAVGKTVLAADPGPERATGVHALAAGAEGASCIPFDDGALRQVEVGGGKRSQSKSPVGGRGSRQPHLPARCAWASEPCGSSCCALNFLATFSVLFLTGRKASGIL